MNYTISTVFVLRDTFSIALHSRCYFSLHFYGVLAMLSFNFCKSKIYANILWYLMKHCVNNIQSTISDTFGKIYFRILFPTTFIYYTIVNRTCPVSKLCPSPTIEATQHCDTFCDNAAALATRQHVLRHCSMLPCRKICRSAALLAA